MSNFISYSSSPNVNFENLMQKTNFTFLVFSVSIDKLRIRCRTWGFKSLMFMFSNSWSGFRWGTSFCSHGWPLIWFNVYRCAGFLTKIFRMRSSSSKYGKDTMLNIQNEDFPFWLNEWCHKFLKSSKFIQVDQLESFDTGFFIFITNTYTAIRD